MTTRIFAFFVLFVTSLLIPRQADALGDLTITPWRVVFQTNDRSAAVQLLNTSDEAHVYRMGWLLLKATAKGGYEPVPYDRDKDKDPHSVPNMTVLSPKQVTIEPHGLQVVRLSLRRPADLPPGEYRAHMTFTRMAHDKHIPKDPNAKAVSLALDVNLGFSIPVIVRQGEDKDLKVDFFEPQLKQEKNYSVLLLELTRVAGKFSTYGTIHAYWTPPKGGEKEIGMINNVALFPELKSRHIQVPITTKDNIVGGKIRVVYEGKYESNGTTWAEKTFPVGTK